jgi:hypothetical protein
MRAGILTLLLFFAVKTDTAAIEEDFGKFIKSARPFRPSENAKVSDLAKGKKQREEFRDEECFTGFFFDEHVFKRAAQHFIGTSWLRRRRSHLG